MAKFVFVNIPSTSHITPTLPIVQELVRRGDEVIYYLTERFRPAIEATGATFRPYETKIDQINKTAFESGKPVGLPMYMVDESLYVIPQIIEDIRLEKPDTIVYDTMCLSGRFIAESLHIPAVNYRMIFAFNKQLAKIFQANALKDSEGIEAFQISMKSLCERYHVQPFHIGSIFTQEEPLNLVTIPRAFQIDGDNFDEKYAFVGPAIAPRNEQIEFPFEQLENQPVIYVTQGTVYNDRADFFNLCFAAFANTKWKVVISIGSNVDQQKLHAVPDNFIVRSYLPQLEVLKYASVCIYHASMTTTMEALAQGVPVVAIPQHIADLPVIAMRLEQLGLGVRLEETTLTPEALLDAAQQVSNEPGYYARVREMQKEIYAAGGFMKAADVLQNFVQDRISAHAANL